ncbi:helix-turn-helix domain-containing protein, partial [Halobacillus litoralis]
MNKFTNEDKFQAVHRYLDETISYRHLAKEIGVDNSVLRYWVKLYEYHGDQAFAPPYTNYSSEFKLKVIACIEDEGYSIREASALFHIPDYSMVRRWMRKWKNGGMGALAS